MKSSVILTVLVLLAASCVASENPDSRASIGIQYFGDFGDLKYSVVGLDRHGGSFHHSFFLSFLIPTSRDVSFWGRLGGGYYKGTFDETLFAYKSINSTRSFSLSLGFTFYVGGSINDR